MCNSRSCQELQEGGGLGTPAAIYLNSEYHEVAARLTELLSRRFRVMCSIRHFSMLALNSHLRDGNARSRNTGCTLVEQNVLQT